MDFHYFCNPDIILALYSKLLLFYLTLPNLAGQVLLALVKYLVDFQFPCLCQKIAKLPKSTSELSNIPRLRSYRMQKFLLILDSRMPSVNNQPVQSLHLLPAQTPNITNDVKSNKCGLSTIRSDSRKRVKLKEQGRRATLVQADWRHFRRKSTAFPRGMSNETAGGQTAKTDTDKTGPRDRKGSPQRNRLRKKGGRIGLRGWGKQQRQRQQKQKGNPEFPLCDLQYEALLNTLLESK